MLEKTVFTNNEEIKNVIKEIYGIITGHIEKIKRGSANIYKIKAVNNAYILKEFQSKYTNVEVEKEINVINHLKLKGVKVPTYVKCLNGNYSFIYKEKTIIMQEFIDGYTMEPNKGNYEQTIESAINLGKIIQGLEDLPFTLPTSDLSSWYSKESFVNSKKKHLDILEMLNDNLIDKKIRNDINAKIKILDDVITNFDFSEMSNLSCKNTHGDYSVMQFIYKDGRINSIIDFVSACKMPIVWEVIRSYSYIDEKAKNGEFDISNFVDYVKEFCKYVNLNKYDIKYMPYLYMVQLLNSTYGYKQFLNNRSNKDMFDFGCLRTNICKYLYKNAELISKKLLEDIEL